MPESSGRRRIRVLFLPAWYPSEVDAINGIFVKEHAKAASLYNDVVVVYVYHNPQAKVKGLYDVSDAMEAGIRTVRIRYRSPSVAGNSPLSRLIRLCSTLSFLHGFMKGDWKPDILHAHVYSAGVAAIVLGRVHRIPVVVSEHWTWFALRKLTWERRLAARFVFNGARMVLPVSEHLRRQIEQYGVKASFRIVPNVVDTQLFHPATTQRQNEDGTKRLLLVARLSEQKGVMYLLHAVKQVRQTRQDFLLDIVGEGTKGSRRQDFEKASRELGLEAMVKFHGDKPKEEAAEFMRRCHLFVQPSLYETFGVVYIEAMASGVPVIACDIPGPNEFITKDVGVLVPPRDTDALAKAIDFMLDHWSDYSPERIAEYARVRFGYEAVGKRLDEVYREVCEK